MAVETIQVLQLEAETTTRLCEKGQNETGFGKCGLEYPEPYLMRDFQSLEAETTCLHFPSTDVKESLSQLCQYETH